jgi:hypothetical protein
MSQETGVCNQLVVLTDQILTLWQNSAPPSRSSRVGTHSVGLFVFRRVKLAEGKSKLSGPDLAEGIPSESLLDGQMLVGHANGEAVLLVRTGQDIFAVSPHCTHYNGPLAEGLVVSETVRCP